MAGIWCFTGPATGPAACRLYRKNMQCKFIQMEMADFPANFTSNPAWCAGVHKLYIICAAPSRALAARLVLTFPRSTKEARAFRNCQFASCTGCSSLTCPGCLCRLLEKPPYSALNPREPCSKKAGHTPFGGGGLF